ncbi:MAG: hypothetical protein JW913_08460 [Chitinispirillaceae bacterium]|nr:hypothetical protein [Chitinispirillaceae bacterium]
MVANEELGRSRNKFLIEGLAKAFEFDFRNPIDEFVDECRSPYDLRYSTSIADQLIRNGFDYSSFSYSRAGAFVRYLADKYGIAKTKELYSASTADTGQKFSGDFERIFGSPVEESEHAFYLKYFSLWADAIDSLWVERR